MLNTYQIEITFSAEQDLKEIYFYIAQTICEKEYAKAQCNKIKDSVFSLSTLPERHALLKNEDLALRGIRKIECGNYLVFYKIVDTRVFVLRVLYAKRKWECII